jgi:predicted O-methyltransferase YrrM
MPAFDRQWLVLRAALPKDGSWIHMAESKLEALLLTMPILARMRPIEGWLEDEEADLLIATAARALAAPGDHPTLVEVGSYFGRSTVVLGSVVRVVCPRAKIFAIDPHEGQISADGMLYQVQGTLEKFADNIAAAGLSDVVETIVKRSFEVVWDRPIRLLLIDALHDYANVARDFQQFERWVEPGGYVAFHDYADYFPGVVAFVNEVLARGRYRQAGLARSLISLWKAPSP